MTTIAELYGLKVPKPFGFKGIEAKGTNPNLMMGMELEIEGCEHYAETYQDMLTKLGWAVTTDDSLRGANLRGGRNADTIGYAYEFISRPMSQGHLLYSVEEFFKATKFTAKNYSDRCSVHIHVNCSDLNFDQLESLCLLYTTVERILFSFIGDNREHNIYCIPWSDCRLNHDIVDRISEEGTSVIKRWAKYTALNLQPLGVQGTVEFRHMAGTSDVQRIHKWVNILGALFAYATSRQITALIDEIKALNSTSEYEVFFNQVFGGLLQYEEKYREALEGGVINAKYSLINWKKNEKIHTDGAKKSAVKAKSTSLFGEAQEYIPDEDYRNTFETIRRNVRNAAAQQRTIGLPEGAPQPRPPITPSPRFMYLSPWPAVGQVFVLPAGGAALASCFHATDVAQLNYQTGNWEYSTANPDHGGLRTVTITRPSRASIATPPVAAIPEWR